MINFVPEDIRPVEPKKKGQSSDFEMEMIQPVKQEEPKPEPQTPPAQSQSKPLVNPWIGGGINFGTEATTEQTKLDTSDLLMKDELGIEQPEEKQAKPKTPFTETKLGKIVVKIKNFIVKIVLIVVKPPRRLGIKKEKNKKRDFSKPASFTPSDLEITLMPEGVPMTKRAVYERVLIVLAIVAFLVSAVFVSWSLVNWRCDLARNKVNEIKGEMSIAEAKINGYQDLLKNIILLEKKSELAIALLDNHVYWTRFFAVLESYTVPDVYYTSFTARADEKIVLPTVGRNLVAAVQQLAAFYSATDYIKEVAITDLNGNTKEVNFNTNLVLQSGVLNK
ncbi:MAG: hypothetical protein PHV78_01430 [Patescibacteria group bacterium]|nr:hypothetical protein [Patescibacteria group bacterium]MDD5121183.1 hypothetical protein [Patescibacteria group bacterium]MDD5221995.1 hypothetical protein [Patescibacteria group bacterium]MDD5395898.1 hypothetical protein [Patescibacteria group bacterium]